jgi:hypothetical protein
MGLVTVFGPLIGKYESCSSMACYAEEPAHLVD